MSSHNLADINPADYAYVGEFYQGSDDDVQSEYTYLHEELDAKIGEEWARRGIVEFHANYGCASCGTQFAYGCVYECATGYVAIGHTCAGHYFEYNDENAMRVARAKRNAANARARARKLAKWTDLLESTPELAELLSVDHEIIADIARYGAKNGGITDAQIDLVAKLAQEVADKANMPEPEPEPKVAAVPTTDERIKIEGSILTTKYQESQFSYYGGTLKMLVLVDTDQGAYKLWGSVPSQLNVSKGDRIQFSATIKRSDNDESFGFFKRPTKAKIL